MEIYEPIMTYDFSKFDPYSHLNEAEAETEALMDAESSPENNQKPIFFHLGLKLHPSKL